MMRPFTLVPLVCGILLAFSYAPGVLHAQEAASVGETSVSSSTLYFFYSPTCPHCRKEQAFLDTIADTYPSLRMERYLVSDASKQELMHELARSHGALEDLGLVPLTFVGEQYFVGYQSDETTGREIENAIRRTLGLAVDEGAAESAQGLDVPFIGLVDPTQYSLPALAVILGFLDGFNVCSLGALVLIIGLALRLQSRRAIILVGGTFLLTTAFVYGILIFLWYQLFDIFVGYLGLLKLGVSLLSLGAGLYFLKEYLRMRTQGAVCSFSDSPLITRITARTEKVFSNTAHVSGLVVAVLLFAAVVALVEFPCSAAVPVVFAGIVAEASLGSMAYIGYIALFILFYLLDELIIFSIAAWRLQVWMTSGSFMKWAVLAEAVTLLGIGSWYLAILAGVV